MNSSHVINNQNVIVVPGEKHPDKKYLVDPGVFTTLSNESKKVLIRVERGGNTTEKEYFMKQFPASSDSICKGEYDAHLKIYRLIEENRETLVSLGVTPGNGIERRPVCASIDSKYPFIVKKPYRENLQKAIGRGVFVGNVPLLLDGAKQLMEGLRTFIALGFLYTDIKAENILFERKGKKVLAFTDFEKTPFSQDGQALLAAGMRVPHFMVPVEELRKMVFSPPQEILPKLHEIYSFNLGAVYFEMATKISLIKFLFLKDFSHYLAENNATNSIIEAFWKKGHELEHKAYHQLRSTLDEPHQTVFDWYAYGTPAGPAISYLTADKAKSAVIEAIKKVGAPKEFAELVGSMVHMDPSKRVDIKDVLPRLNSIKIDDSMTADDPLID